MTKKLLIMIALVIVQIACEMEKENQNQEEKIRITTRDDETKIIDKSSVAERIPLFKSLIDAGSIDVNLSKLSYARKNSVENIINIAEKFPNLIIREIYWL